MSTWPTVTRCARPECGQPETMHKIRTDGRSRGGTDDGVCAGFQPGRVEERPPEGELRRRLAAVEALADEHAPVPLDVWPGYEDPFTDGWNDAIRAALRAARGES